MNHIVADPFLTPSEVLTRLRVNVKTLYRLIGTGELPAVRIGRQWRVRPLDLESWLRRHQSGSTLQTEPVGGTPGIAPTVNLACHPDSDGTIY
jgi:excisionase family DNA binding protein